MKQPCSKVLIYINGQKKYGHLRRYEDYGFPDLELTLTIEENNNILVKVTKNIGERPYYNQI
ncbi:MAG: hypothetical protein K0R94_857 [Burkholderiales bacterium]|jgi:hypothetical protein|nr:hypothetical protein [Burkholderiales bacterium]